MINDSNNNLVQFPCQDNATNAWTSPYYNNNGIISINIEVMVTDIIHAIGVPAHIQGYYYLREAIIFAVNNQESVNIATKVIYPSIAEKFNTTPIRIESGIRYALNIAWYKCGFVSLEKSLGSADCLLGKKPTNAVFIAFVVDRLNMMIKFAEMADEKQVSADSSNAKTMSQ